MGDSRNNYAGFGRRPALRIQQSPSRSLTASSSAAIVIGPGFSNADIVIGSGSFHGPTMFHGPGTSPDTASARSTVVSVSEENTEVFAVSPAILSLDCDAVFLFTASSVFPIVISGSDVGTP